MIPKICGAAKHAYAAKQFAVDEALAQNPPSGCQNSVWAPRYRFTGQERVSFIKSIGRIISSDETKLPECEFRR